MKITHVSLQVKDIPKAVIIHEILGLIMLAVTWTICYYHPPSQIPLLTPHLARVSTSYIHHFQVNRVVYVDSSDNARKIDEFIVDEQNSFE